MVQRCTPNYGDEERAKEMYTWHAAEWDYVLKMPAMIQKGRNRGVRGMVAEVHKQSERENETDRMGVNSQNQSTRETGIWPPLPPGAHMYARDEALHGNHFPSVMVLIRRWVMFLNSTYHPDTCCILY